MTREERKKAIEVLDDMKVKIDIPKAAKTQNDRNWALDVAIQALSQEPCDDAISREAVKELIKCGVSTDTYDDVEQVCKWIDALPSVTQKSGVWVEIDDEPHEVWECDHCGFVIDGSGCIEPYEYRDTYKFCPNCGAKMESEEV